MLNGNILNAIEASAFTLEQLMAMTANELNSIKINGISEKYMAKFRIYRLMIRAGESNGTTEYVINEVRQLFNNQKVADYLANPKTYKYFRLIHLEFLTNKGIDKKLAAWISRLKGQDLLSKRVGQLSTAMPRYAYIGELSNSDVESAYLSLAGTIMNGLVSLGYAKEVPVITYPMVNGKRIRKTTLEIAFDGKETKVVDQTKGLSTTPGSFINKRIRVKIGGIPRKYTSTEKTFLRELASIPLRFVEISESEFKDTYLKNEKWYTQALALKIEDRIALNKRVDMYYDIYLAHLNQTIFLSMHMDYRTRMYYDFTNVALSVSTKAGKYFMEAVEPQLQHQASYELHISCAVKLATGKRLSSKKANKLYKNDPQAILASLRGTTEKHFSDILYERRLADAIQDIEANKPIHFLLAQDATNGGLQRFAAEFKSEKAMLASNIAGNANPNDSHSNIATAFDIDRKVAKDNISQGAIHGQAFASMAKAISLVTGRTYTEPEAKQFMVEAFGDEITNIPEFNAFGRAMYDNSNSCLLWRTQDGMQAQSIAFNESVKMKVWSLINNEDMVRSLTITKNMPIKFTPTGEVVHDKAKTSGVYPNTTHSIDAVAMRTVMRPLIAINAPALFNHDMIITFGNHHVDIVAPAMIQGMIDQAKDNSYTRSLTEMSENRIGITMPLPEFKYGTGTNDMIKQSTCHMSA